MESFRPEPFIASRSPVPISSLIWAALITAFIHALFSYHFPNTHTHSYCLLSIIWKSLFLCVRVCGLPHTHTRTLGLREKKNKKTLPIIQRVNKAFSRRWHRLDKKVSSQAAVAGRQNKWAAHSWRRESANAVKAIVLIFQDECSSMESNSAAPFTSEPDYCSLQGDLAIHLFMLRAAAIV